MAGYSTISNSFKHDSEIEAVEKEYSTSVRRRSLSTNQVSISNYSPPHTAIVSSVVKEEEPRMPKLEDHINISVIPFELNQQRQELKTPRTVSTTNPPKLLSIDSIAARRIERNAVNCQTKKTCGSPRVHNL